MNLQANSKDLETRAGHLWWKNGGRDHDLGGQVAQSGESDEKNRMLEGRALTPASESHSGLQRDRRKPGVLRSLIEEMVHANADWRRHMRALLDEHERLEQRQMNLIAAAVERYELSAAHGEHHLGDLRDMVEEYERTLIVWALVSAGGQQNRAAAFLGVGASTLCEKMKRLHIEMPKTHDHPSVHHRPHRRPQAHH